MSGTCSLFPPGLPACYPLTRMKNLTPGVMGLPWRMHCRGAGQQLSGAGVEDPQRILESGGAGPVWGVVEEEVREVGVWLPGVCLACASAVRSFNRPLRAQKPIVSIPSSTGSFHQQVFIGYPDKSKTTHPACHPLVASQSSPNPLSRQTTPCMASQTPASLGPLHLQSNHPHVATPPPSVLHVLPLAETLIAAFFFNLPNSHFSSDPQLRCELLQEALPD